MDANDQLRKAREYEPLVIHYNADNGAPVRLGDVAQGQRLVEDVRNAGFSDDLPAVLLIVTRQPGANIIEATDAIHAQLPVLQELLGPQVKLNVMDDRSPSIRASLEEAELTLLISVALVILVVFLFLRNGRATLIPSLAVPVSLIGTFRGHVPVRLQPEQPVADGADHRHRLRGGRRHCGGGEHRPTHRGGRSADPGGDHRRPPGRFHRVVDDALAGRGVHPAAAHGRPHRAVVPRVRGDSLGGDPGVPGGIPDPHADALRASAASAETARGRFPGAAQRSLLRRLHAALPRQPGLGAGALAADGGDHAGLHRHEPLVVRGGALGFLPQQDSGACAATRWPTRASRSSP